MKVISGLDNFLQSPQEQSKAVGRVAYLCHSASVNKELQLGIFPLQAHFGSRLVKIFSPQHGLFADVQDNMVETPHVQHSAFGLPIYSLYSETRVPSDDMLADVDTVIVDLQDVGTRIYTYVYTMTLLMEKCGKLAKRVLVFDRPNPVNGIDIEGNILEDEFSSFVGRHPIPVRHGMTIAEVAQFAHSFCNCKCDLKIVPMLNWKREMSFEKTQLPWVLPSPNMPTLDTAFAFIGSVALEGTSLSEGRGTSRPFEIIGHPKIQPFQLHTKILDVMKQEKLDGFTLRPMHFLPTFQKHAQTPCGGFQLHITDRKVFRPWLFINVFLREIYRQLEGCLTWKLPPYEYEYEKLPIDLINGSGFPRLWIEEYGTTSALRDFEQSKRAAFMEKRAEVLIY